MRKKIRPTVDCVFKAIFGKNENRNLVTNFLNAVLETDGGNRITGVTILNPYNEREFENAKLSIVDVKVRDEGGRYCQIEIQLSVAPWLPGRMLHNWAALYHSQMGKGEAYDSLKPAISIWILDGVLFAPSEETADTDAYLHLAFETRERHLGFRLNGDFGIHMLQLPYWNPEHPPDGDKERWVHFFREGENMEVNNLPEGMDTEEMRQAFAVLDNFASNKEEYFLYLGRLEAARQERTWKNAVERARRELEQERREKEQARMMAEQERREKEQERREKEQARMMAEQERREKERLALLLKKAGISYDDDE